MTNEELKEKICKIIADNYLPKEMPDRLEDYKLYRFKRVAEALIAAGLTFEPMTFRTVKNKPYSYTAAELANWKEDQDRIAKLLHRAEVAERALDKATELAYTYRTQEDTLSCSSCPFDSIFDRCKERGLYEDCSKRWKEELLQQSEKELQEEKKSD